MSERCIICEEIIKQDQILAETADGPIHMECGPLEDDDEEESNG